MANYDVDDVELDDMMNDEVVIMFDELNVPFTELEVSDAIKVTKNGKSGGEDLLINEFLAPPAERQRSFSNADSSVVRRPSSVVRRPSSSSSSSSVVRRPSSTFQLKA